MILAVAALPILGAAGLALDYIGAVKHQTAMQVAVDAAALAGAQSGELSDDERTEIATKVFNANLAAETGGKDRVYGVDVAVQDETIAVTATGQRQTTLMGLLGQKKVDLIVSAIAALPGSGQVEVALVLDYSASMNSSSKYQAMRDAAINLVETLSNNRQNRNVKFSLVPFSQHVYAELPASFVVGGTAAGASWSGCTKDRRYPHNVTASAPSDDDNTKWGDPSRGTTWDPNTGNGWAGSNSTPTPTCTPGTIPLPTTGTCTIEVAGEIYEYTCIVDPPPGSDPNCSWGSTSTNGGWTSGWDPMDDADIDPDAWTGWGDVDECHAYLTKSLVVREMSDDFDGIIGQLQEMTPHDLTHIAVGLAFGWHTLTPEEPFTGAASTSDQAIEKILVLLTDGEPTVPAWGPGDVHTVGQVNKNVEELCQNVKADNITVVTMAFDLGDSETKDRLRNCASSAAHFFDAATNTELANAFNEIAQKLAGPVRLIK